MGRKPISDIKFYSVRENYLQRTEEVIPYDMINVNKYGAAAWDDIRTLVSRAKSCELEK